MGASTNGSHAHASTSVKCPSPICATIFGADLTRTLGNLISRQFRIAFPIEQNPDPNNRGDWSEDPRADLERLLEAALAHAGADLNNMRFELALRDLGRRDGPVAEMLFEVDQLRLALFEKKFRRLTGDDKTAGELAVLFYLAIVGSNQALSRPSNPPQVKSYLISVIGRYLIEQQVGASA